MRRGAAERKRLREWKLKWDDTLENYIDLRLIELQIGCSDLLARPCTSSVWVIISWLCVVTPLISRSSDATLRLDVWWLYIQRMEQWGGMSESGRLSGIPGTCGAYQSLNLSLSPEDWENFSIVHAPPTFCLLPQELLCDWAWLGGESARMSGATGNMKISVCAESRVRVSHPILLICCAVIPAIALHVCLSPPHFHRPAYTCQTLTHTAYVYVSPNPCKQK